MPIYPCKCEVCGHYDEPIRPVSEYDNHPLHCGQPMKRVLTAPMITPDIQPYRSMVTGQMVTSRKEHREMLRKHNLVEVGSEKIIPKKKRYEPNSDEIKRELWAAMS